VRHFIVHTRRAGQLVTRPLNCDVRRQIVRAVSATHSAFSKRVLPFVGIAGACAWLYWSRRDTDPSLALALFWTAVLTIIMVLTLRRGLWLMADTVVDCGDSLLVTRWRTRVSVPLSNVRALRRVPVFIGIDEMWITLDQPSAIGSEIGFYAPDKRRAPANHEALEGLIRRIESANLGRAKSVVPVA
jgi:hypothetical protein